MEIVLKAAVVVFPGSNCDQDVAIALEQSSGSKPLMLWHNETNLPSDLDIIVLPGGFSYGDYLRSGAMAAHAPIMREIHSKAREGMPVLGICNGFQILTEAGLLPGSLMHNIGLCFICKDVFLRVESTDSLFTELYTEKQVIYLPIAHQYGSYFIDSNGFQRLVENEQIAFRYCSHNGTADMSVNPNGSYDNIAGVFSRDRRILGMMPHPERSVNQRLGGSDGKPIFDAIMEALS